MRVKLYLTKKGVWNDEMEKQFLDESSKTIDAAVEKAEKVVADPKSMFQHTYSYIPQVLKDELDDAVASNFWQNNE